MLYCMFVCLHVYMFVNIHISLTTHHRPIQWKLLRLIKGFTRLARWLRKHQPAFWMCCSHWNAFSWGKAVETGSFWINVRMSWQLKFVWPTTYCKLRPVILVASCGCWWLVIISWWLVMIWTYTTWEPSTVTIQQNGQISQFNQRNGLPVGSRLLVW